MSDQDEGRAWGGRREMDITTQELRQDLDADPPTWRAVN